MLVKMGPRDLELRCTHKSWPNAGQILFPFDDAAVAKDVIGQIPLGSHTLARMPPDVIGALLFTMAILMMNKGKEEEGR
jgi:hypothetical protein